MNFSIYTLLLLLLLSGCSTWKSASSLGEYSYVDSLVTAKTVSFASTAPIDCLATTLQREAGNQPAQGIYAVGVTIMTRAKGEPRRICKATRARRQFEGVRRYGSVKVSRKVLGIAQVVLKNRETGWTHFWAPKTQARLKRRKPAWASAYEKRQCKKQTIGDHVFFNNNLCQISKRRFLNAQND